MWNSKVTKLFLVWSKTFQTCPNWFGQVWIWTYRRTRHWDLKQFLTCPNCVGQVQIALDSVKNQKSFLDLFKTIWTDPKLFWTYSRAKKFVELTWFLKFSTNTNSNLQSRPRGLVSDIFCFKMTPATVTATSINFSGFSCSSIVVLHHSPRVQVVSMTGVDNAKPRGR